MTTISCYIIAFNEANKIRPAIESVIEWADEVILCDSHSTDDTAKIAEELGARVVQIDFNGFDGCEMKPLHPVSMSGFSRWILTNVARPKHVTRSCPLSEKMIPLAQSHISCRAKIICLDVGFNIRAGILITGSPNCFDKDA